MPWFAIAEVITGATGSPCRPERHVPVSGGSINAAFRLESGRRRFFVKLNDPGRVDMFAGEADGLEALAAAHALRVPGVIACGETAGRSFIVLEWIDLCSRGDWAALGEGLARQHQCLGHRHGWHRDNTIGNTAQVNSRDEDWAAFFAAHRLGYQLDLARRAGAPARTIDRGERVRRELGRLFAGYQPAPSLLHGDLWSGNVGFDAHGGPVIFDPAVHYGDRECDLAMSELFGGFPEAFHSAYDAVWPRDPGYWVRRDLYQLYHVLNHFNLFGGGYAASARSLIDRLLAAMG